MSGMGPATHERYWSMRNTEEISGLCGLAKKKTNEEMYPITYSFFLKNAKRFRTHFCTKPLVYLPLCFLYKKVPTIPVETHSFNFPTIIKRWCQPFGFHARNLMNSFGCNFLSSSTGFNPCSCFFRLTLAFYFRFWLLWAFRSTAYRRFPSAF